MSLGTREIKRRIKSVANTKKITKAMELVSAVKMRKAVEAVLATRDYSNAAWDIVKNLSAKTDSAHHSLLQSRDEIKTIGVVLLASNKGLCGGFNREIVELTARYINDEKKRNPNVKAEIILMGKRGSNIMHKHGHVIVSDFEKSDVAESVSEVSVLSKLVISDYINGKYDKVILVYTDYKSTIQQRALVRTLLPIENKDEELGYAGKDDSAQREQLQEFEYVFEPSPDAVLEQMLYRLIELQVYQALLESNASEHSARMMAMRNASDAAGDMIDDLTLTFNQARQQVITAELADISAGSAAIR